MFKRRSVLGAMALAPLALRTSAARAGATGSGPSFTPALIAEIEALIVQNMPVFDIIGTAIALIQNGEVIYAKGFGVRDLQTGAPYTVDSVHRIASTTKSMTSMLNAMLVDEGQYGWDTLVRTISTRYRFPTQELTNSTTVRHMLNMSTGLGESEIEPYIDLQTPRVFFRTLATLPVLAPPQTEYFYNDYVYAGAGYLYLLQQGTALGNLPEAYAALMKQRLFEPMGMPTTAITSDPTTLSDNVSKSYGFDLRYDEQPNQVQPYLKAEMVSPSGATSTTLLEMARYLITQLNGGVTPDGTRIVSSEALAETWKGVMTVSTNPPAAYAMGWMQVVVDKIPYTWHNGSVDSFKTDMSMLPEGNLGILIFSNTESGTTFHQAIRGHIIERLYNLEQTAVAAAQAAYASAQAVVHALKEAITAYQVPEETIAPFLGRYEKGWTVQHIDGVPMVTRTDGVQWVLLPTADGYRVCSTTYSNGFQDAVAFVTDTGGQVHMQITNPNENNALVDQVSRLSPDT